MITARAQRHSEEFPQIPDAIAIVFCTGKEGMLSLSIMMQWGEFYVADEHTEGKLSGKFPSEELAFDAIQNMTKIAYGEKYSIWYM